MLMKRRECITIGMQLRQFDIPKFFIVEFFEHVVSAFIYCSCKVEKLFKLVHQLLQPLMFLYNFK